MDMEDVVHIYSGILLSHKKNEIMPFAATWMDLVIVLLSGVNQRKISYGFTCMSNIKKNNTNELAYKTDSQISKASLSL